MENKSKWLLQLLTIIILISCSKSDINTITQNESKLSSTPVSTGTSEPYSGTTLIVEFEPNTSEEIRKDMRAIHGVISYKECKNCGDDNLPIYEEWTVLNGSIDSENGTTIEEKVTSVKPPEEDDSSGVEGAGLNFNYSNNLIGLILPEDDPSLANTLIAPSNTNGVIIATIDTGINSKHLDDIGASSNLFNNDNSTNCIAENNWGWDFVNEDAIASDENGHGTFIYQIINMMIPNPNYEILPIKVFNDQGKANSFDVLCGVRYAILQQVNIVNMSFGNYKKEDKILRKLMETYGSNTLFIASAGNTENNNDHLSHYPSSYDMDNLIAVAATDASAFEAASNLAYYSNYGPVSVDIAGPGVITNLVWRSISNTETYDNSIWDILTNQELAVLGTSYATAYATAKAASTWTPDMTSPIELKNKLIQNTKYLPNLSQIKYSAYISD